jgi:hypothetical protein
MPFTTIDSNWLCRKQIHHHRNISSKIEKAQNDIFSSADEIHAPEDPACALCHMTEDERALLVRMVGDYRNIALAAPTMPEEKVCSARGET